MAECRWVALFDGGDRRRDEALEESLDAFVELAVFDGYCCLSRQAGHQVDGTTTVGSDLCVEVFWSVENRFTISLAIDELECADDLALVIPHGNRQHRFRAVSVLFVERPVDGVLDVRRKEVGIVDHQRLSGTGHITRDTGVIDGNGELVQRNLGARMILCDLEPQHLCAVLGGFDQIQAACVR